MQRAPAKQYYFEGYHQYGDGGNTNLFSEVLIGTESTTAHSVPNYKALLAKHQDASSPYLRNFLEWQLPLMHSSSYNKNTKRDAYCDSRFKFAINAKQSIPHDASLRDLALKRIKSKISTNYGSFSTLIPLGEIKETRALIGTTAETTTALVKSLLNWKRRGVKDIVARASDAWLNFSFAISPTIADTYDLIDTIGTHLSRQDFFKEDHAGARRDWVDTNVAAASIPAAQGLSWVNRDNRIYDAQLLSYTYTVGLFYNLKSGNNYTAVNRFGLTFGDIVPAAWELTPFSWVVDYFTTMGDFLEDTYTSPPGNTVFCNLSSKYVSTQQANVMLRNDNPSGYINTTALREYLISCKSTIYQREVMAVLPHRSLRLKTSDEIINNSVNKLLNLTSILGSGLPSFQRRRAWIEL